MVCARRHVHMDITREVVAAWVLITVHMFVTWRKARFMELTPHPS